MPIVPDVSFPTLIGGTPKKKRRPYTHTAKGRTVKLGRKPTPLEEKLLSLTEIPARLDAEVAKLAETLLFLRREHLAGASSAADLRDLTDDTAALLLSVQTDVARYGAFEFRQEVSRQGVVNLTDDFGFEERVRADARLLSLRNRAARQLNDTWTDVVNLAETRLRRAQPSAAPEQWRRLAERQIETGLKYAARDVVNAGFSIGRYLERHRLLSLKEFEPEMLVFTAVLDANTCDECYDADGTEFEEDSEDEIKYSVPYYLCEGGDKCRCQIVAIGSEPGWVNAAIEHLAIIHLHDDAEPTAVVSLDREAALKAWESRARAVKVKKTADELERTFAVFQEDPANTRKEISGAINRTTGELIFTNDIPYEDPLNPRAGGVDDAQFVSKMIDAGDENVLHVHTHPDDNAFSDGDWKVFAWSHIGEMRVVTKDHVYTIEKTPAFAKVPYAKRTPAVLQQRWDKLSEDLWDSTWAEYGQGDDMVAELTRRINQTMAGELGVTFTARRRERVKHLTDPDYSARSKKAWESRGRAAQKEKKGKVVRVVNMLDRHTEENVLGPNKAADVAANIVGGLDGDYNVTLMQTESSGGDVEIMIQSEETVLREKRIFDPETGKEDKEFYQVPMVKMARRYTRNEAGELVVLHDSFLIAKEKQAQGFGKDVMRSQMAEYSRLGVSKVMTDANLDVGGYAWARYGFTATDTKDFVASMEERFDEIQNNRDEHRALMPGQVDEDGRPDATPAINVLRGLIEQYKDDPQLPWRIADARFGKHQIGKQFMRGTAWNGTLDLRDPETMSRLTRYLDQPRP